MYEIVDKSLDRYLIIMDLLSTDDFFKYTDYNEILNEWGSNKEMMARNSSKYKIAKTINHKELYKVIINEYFIMGMKYYMI